MKILTILISMLILNFFILGSATALKTVTLKKGETLKVQMRGQGHNATNFDKATEEITVSRHGGKTVITAPNKAKVKKVSTKPAKVKFGCVGPDCSL